MDKTVQIAVCYLPIGKFPPSISEYVKSQKLNQMRTFSNSLGITVSDIYVDEGFEQMPADKPELKKIIDRLPKKDFHVFIADSIYDLGNHFLECTKTLQYLVEHHIRVICLNNHIDSAIDALLIQQAAENFR
ncbi:MAG: recombinase family protein [Clostridiales bacterium]|nr:recombinase family protein [Clostridiales bacterium]